MSTCGPDECLQTLVEWRCIACLWCICACYYRNDLLGQPISYVSVQWLPGTFRSQSSSVSNGKSVLEHVWGFREFRKEASARKCGQLPYSLWHHINFPENSLLHSSPHLNFMKICLTSSWNLFWKCPSPQNSFWKFIENRRGYRGLLALLDTHFGVRRKYMLLHLWFS